MTKRIFRSIFLVAMTVLLAAMALIMGAMYNHYTNVQFNQLRVETALASHAVANEGTEYFHKLDDTMDCRITLIGQDGTVLYDNRSDSGTMENHLARQEVISALQSGYGQSARYSNTLMERYIYAAERLPDGTVLRLSTAQTSVLNLMLGMFWQILLVIAVISLLSYTLARRLSRSIVRPLNALNLEAPLHDREYEEIRPLLLRLESQQSQLQQQSRQLAQQQKEFSAVTRALSEGLVLLSAGGTILSINPAAARLLEVTPNCAGADFSVANRNASISALVEQAYSGKKAEQPLPFPAGIFLVAARPVKTGEQISGVALLMVDVTQEKQAEALRREFTANVSHELKTPIHAISGYAELMKNGLVQPGDIPQFSEKIYSEAQRLIRLVEDILRLSRLEDSSQDLQWSQLDLWKILQDIAAEREAAAELAGVRLILEGGPASIRAIPQLVSAIVSNLTDNAIKYNRPGGNVTLRLEPLAGEVRLHVSDTGIGIPEAHQERVFERFYRVDKSHSKAVGGTGLGLSIVKHAALILNAPVQLHSIPDKGTTVTVSFPQS